MVRRWQNFIRKGSASRELHQIIAGCHQLKWSFHLPLGWHFLSSNHLEPCHWCWLSDVKLIYHQDFCTKTKTGFRYWRPRTRPRWLYHWFKINLNFKKKVVRILYFIISTLVRYLRNGMWIASSYLNKGVAFSVGKACVLPLVCFPRNQTVTLRFPSRAKGLFTNYMCLQSWLHNVHKILHIKTNL